MAKFKIFGPKHTLASVLKELSTGLADETISLRSQTGTRVLPAETIVYRALSAKGRPHKSASPIAREAFRHRPAHDGSGFLRVSLTRQDAVRSLPRNFGIAKLKVEQITSLRIGALSLQVLQDLASPANVSVVGTPPDDYKLELAVSGSLARAAELCN